jgi:hypothetical protein
MPHPETKPRLIWDARQQCRELGHPVKPMAARSFHATRWGGRKKRITAEGIHSPNNNGWPIADSSNSVCWLFWWYRFCRKYGNNLSHVLMCIVVSERCLVY